MKYLNTVLRQTGRNLTQTWPTQLMTVLTVSISVLIFSFFFLTYLNVLKAGAHVGDEFRIVVYLDKEPTKEFVDQIKAKMNTIARIEEIVIVSRDEAFSRLQERLGQERDIVADLNSSFLPPALEVQPAKNFENLANIKALVDYLSALPGVIKVRSGQDWVERFDYFVKLMRMVVLLSATLLILTTVFMVSSTIKLAAYQRQAELEVLRLLGATHAYIRSPFLIEGLLQGLVGSGFGLGLLFAIFQGVKSRLGGFAFFNLLELSFFPFPIVLGLITVSILLCIGGSLISTRRFLRI